MTTWHPIIMTWHPIMPTSCSEFEDILPPVSCPRGENTFLLDQASGFLETEPANFKKTIVFIIIIMMANYFLIKIIIAKYFLL